VIEAVRWSPFVRWFNRQAQRRIARTFASVRVHGLQTLEACVEEAPVLLVANHTAWWDALVALWLSETRMPTAQTYGLMDAANLAQLRFFRWLGVFGVDRTSRRDGARATRYALDRLRTPRTMLWVFPQGEEQPAHVPLRFFPGAAGIARRSTAVRVVPVAFAYVFEGDERPHVYVSIGAPLSYEDGADPKAQALAVGEERRRIATAQEGGAEAFIPLLSRTPSRLSRWATACLDRFAGWLMVHQERSRKALPARVKSSPASAPRP